MKVSGLPVSIPSVIAAPKGPEVGNQQPNEKARRVDDRHHPERTTHSPKENLAQPAGKRTAELLGHFKASQKAPERAEKPNDLRPQVETEKGEHERIGHGRLGGRRARRAIRTFGREVHQQLKDVRQGLKESGLSEEEMKGVRHELAGLEKDFRMALRDARQGLRHGGPGPGKFFEAASTVNQAFEGLVAGIEKIVTDRESPAPETTSGNKVSLSFVGSQSATLEVQSAPTKPAGETEPAQAPVTDHAPVAEHEEHVAFDGRGLRAHPRPVATSLREGFSSLLSSLETLSASLEAEVTETDPETTPKTVSVELPREPANEGGSSFELQLAISSYSEVNLSISIQTGGEKLSVLS